MIWECLDCCEYSAFDGQFWAGLHVMCTGHKVKPFRPIERRADPRRCTEHDGEGIWIERLGAKSATCSKCGYAWLDDPNFGCKEVQNVGKLIGEALRSSDLADMERDQHNERFLRELD